MLKKFAVKALSAIIQWVTILVFAFALGIAAKLIWTLFSFGWDLI